MTTKRNVSKRGESPVVGPSASLPIATELLSLEAEFTPKLWIPITKHNPELKEKLLGILNQGPTLDLESKFDPKLFMDGLKRVLDALDRANWQAEAASKVLACIFDYPSVKLESVELWVRSHPSSDWDAICDCITLVPPADILVLRRLPKKGSQKIVFEASWSLYQKTVILKKPLAPDSILRREMNSSPLVNEHRNIIKTYTLWNQKKEIFLVEEKLEKVLSDDSRTKGTAETALLIHDVASALAHLKAKQYVHGDVKPDNVGFDDDHFILLDFGICRPAKEFDSGKSATGSLRTRAPELLTGEGRQSWQSDVWALGATIICFTTGKFPLIEETEDVPRVSNEPLRKKFEEKLRNRVLTEFESRLSTLVRAVKEQVDERIGRILEHMLHRNPEERYSPEEVVVQVRKELPHAVPNTGAGRALMPAVDEAKALLAMWPSADAVRRLPSSRFESVRKRADELAFSLGAESEFHARLKTLAEPARK